MIVLDLSVSNTFMLDNKQEMQLWRRKNCIRNCGFARCIETCIFCELSYFYLIECLWVWAFICSSAWKNNLYKFWPNTTLAKKLLSQKIRSENWVKSAENPLSESNESPEAYFALSIYSRLGVESNCNLFEIRSIRFENLRFDWFERAKNIRKIRWKLIRNSFDSIRLQL